MLVPLRLLERLSVRPAFACASAWLRATAQRPARQHAFPLFARAVAFCAWLSSVLAHRAPRCSPCVRLRICGLCTMRGKNHVMIWLSGLCTGSSRGLRYQEWSVSIVATRFGNIWCYSNFMSSKKKSHAAQDGSASIACQRDG